MDKEYLTAEEVAERLNYHPRTIRRLLVSGELPGRKIGKEWRISAAALRKFIERGGNPANKTE